jgi:uncharacterized protein YecE (DUF72 family)
VSIQVNIGTCGFGRTKDDYYEFLQCVEIQHTFYQPPQLQTLERWRRDAPTGFEFTIKAWQLITHGAKSPTYKRLKEKLSEEELAQAGYFKPTPIVERGWATTLASARALGARTILFQCPASFKPTSENIENLSLFFSGIDRTELNLCWEPRGDWDGGVVKQICDEFDLWHTVDPFKNRSVTPARCYFRLHGRDGWRYKYEEGELGELAEMLPDDRTSYVFFNNREMLDDAIRFKEIVSGRG